MHAYIYEYNTNMGRGGVAFLWFTVFILHYGPRSKRSLGGAANPTHGTDRLFHCYMLDESIFNSWV